jgi:hypothetical protein
MERCRQPCPAQRRLTVTTAWRAVSAWGGGAGAASGELEHPAQVSGADRGQWAGDRDREQCQRAVVRRQWMAGFQGVRDAHAGISRFAVVSWAVTMSTSRRAWSGSRP